jgi:hypothetical protein
MKKIVFILFVFLCPAIVKAATVNWSWAQSIGSTDRDFVSGISTDANSNVYVAGVFFGPTLNLNATTKLTYIGPGSVGNFYVAKFDGSGNLLWAHNGGGTSLGSLGLNIVTTDVLGNVYVAGSYAGSGMKFNNAVFKPSGNNAFVLKIDPTGSVLLTKEITSARILSVAASGTDIYVSGSFASNKLDIDGTILTNAGDFDAFVLKMNSSGTLAWAYSIGGTDFDRAVAMCIGNTGDLYLAGSFITSANIGSQTLTSQGGSDIFIARYSTTGTLKWVKTVGGTNSDIPTSIAVDNADNIYIGGEFVSPTISFGGGTVTHTANNLQTNMLLVKYDAGGTEKWIRNAGGSGASDYSSTKSVSVDIRNHVYVSGTFNASSIAFGSITLGTKPNFLVEYDASGTAVWGESYSGNTSGVISEDVNWLSTDKAGNLFITGQFQTPITLGTTNQLTPVGNKDVWIAKLTTPAANVTSQRQDKYQLILYPNPAIDEVVIDGNWQEGQLKIFDITGKVVYDLNVKAPYTINTTDFANGNYILAINKKDGSIIAKFNRQK